MAAITYMCRGGGVVSMKGCNAVHDDAPYTTENDTSAARFYGQGEGWSSRQENYMACRGELARGSHAGGHPSHEVAQRSRVRLYYSELWIATLLINQEFIQASG